MAHHRRYPRRRGPSRPSVVIDYFREYRNDATGEHQRVEFGRVDGFFFCHSYTNLAMISRRFGEAMSAAMAAQKRGGRRPPNS